MKKFVLYTLLFMGMAGSGLAQKTSYQGEVNIGTSFKSSGATALHMETVHGVRMNSRFFVGLGGLLHQRWTDGGINSFIPIFLNAKGYLTEGRTRPYLSLNAGYNFVDGANELELSGRHYLGGGAGVNLYLSQKLSLNFGLGYHNHHYQWSKTASHTDFWTVHLGLVF